MVKRKAGTTDPLAWKTLDALANLLYYPPLPALDDDINDQCLKHDLITYFCPHNHEEHTLVTMKQIKKGKKIVEIGPADVTNSEVLDTITPTQYRKRSKGSGGKKKSKKLPRHLHEFLCDGEQKGLYFDDMRNANLMFIDLVKCRSATLFIQSASKERGTVPNCKFASEYCHRRKCQVGYLEATRDIDNFEELLEDYWDHKTD